MKRQIIDDIEIYSTFQKRSFIKDTLAALAVFAALAIFAVPFIMHFANLFR